MLADLLLALIPGINWLYSSTIEHRWSLSGSRLDGSNLSQKVPITLGVMSRCPDAIYCESVFDNVLKEVKSKATIELTFIARENSSAPVYPIQCLHGPWECAGNIQELCAAKYYPQSKWWPFVQCLNNQGRYEIGYDKTAQFCADRVQLEWATINECASSDEGLELLKESIKYTRSLHITKSCTIIISGRKRCVRDGDWKECEGGHSVSDFVEIIDEEYEKLNSQEATIRRIPPLPLRIQGM